MRITPDLLARATGCPPEAAETFAPHLDAACERYQINTPARLAAFLAQIGHESGGLRHVRELASGEAYEGRESLGNTEPGDGPRFRGRGILQVTGRRNYRRQTELLRDRGSPDFEADPEALESPQWAAWSAAAYWDENKLNQWADRDQFDIISNLINTGRKDRIANGTEDRKRRHALAKQAIAMHVEPDVHTEAPEHIHIPAGEAGPPERTMPLPAILGALLPSLIESIPRLGKIFGSGSAVAERNVKAAELAMTIAKDAVGAVNAQDAIEKIRADPSAAQAAARAIETQWWQLSEAGGGGIDGANKRDMAFAQSDGPRFWHSPVFWITVMLTPLVYIALYAVLFRDGFSNDIKAMVLGAIFGGLLTGGIQSYFYGTSASSQRKTEMLGGQR